MTDENGDGRIEVRLDFDLVNRAPVSNKDIIAQCVPDPFHLANGTLKIDKGCSTEAANRSLKITTTWLRKFIGQVVLDGGDPAKECANYDPAFDPRLHPEGTPNGANALLWQCIDPKNGLPVVRWFKFDHFRLANHPDDLTHGFIGGNGIDHWIDMVGRHQDLEPGISGLSQISKKSGGSLPASQRGSRPGNPK